MVIWIIQCRKKAQDYATLFAVTTEAEAQERINELKQEYDYVSTESFDIGLLYGYSKLE